MTMSSKGLTPSPNISVQLVITFKVSSSLDPIRPGQNVDPNLGPNCLQRVYNVMLKFNAKFKYISSTSAVITCTVSNSLDPDKALTEYRPDLGVNCLQRVISR